jgi:hypothetical protein
MKEKQYRDSSEEQCKDAAPVVQIDPNNLDKECIRLPSQYLQYAHTSAELKRDVDELKAELEVTEADLSKEIRANPNEFGIEKVTESAISGVVITSKRYRKALQNLQEVRYHQELAQAVVWALEHKKRSLTLLVELHGMGYFSAPKVSPEGKEAVERMTQRKVRRRVDED